MICIQVFDRNCGKPGIGYKVSLLFNGIVRLGYTNDEYSDTEGCTYFDYEPYYDTTVYVNEKEVFRGDVSGKKIIYI